MANFDRRTFIALLSTPAVLSLLQACGGGDGSDTDGTDTGPDDTATSTTTAAAVGFGEARSGLPREAGDPAAAAGAARAVNAFAADLYQRIGADTTNLVFSPASILIALAMARAGAAGATANEMDAVLHTDQAGPAEGAIHPAMNSLTAALEERSGSFPTGGGDADVRLAIANSLWGQDGLAWAEAFLNLLATQYGAGLRLVDYVGDPEAARAAINTWVNDETEGRIPELLAQGTVSADSRLTLVNAVYLKAPWMQPFVEDATVTGAFTTVSGATVQVPMMHASRSFAHAIGPRWQAVEIPYVGGSLAMLLVVPDAGALGEVEQGLGSGLLDEITASLGRRQVNLGMPKFDIETKAELTSLLAALGMPSAFDPDAADFSAMTAEEQLFIGFVVHQANITVDEAGTEAAAATAVGMEATAAPSDPVELEIDRPFVYVLRDAPTGTVLFLGRVGDPS